MRLAICVTATLLLLTSMQIGFDASKNSILIRVSTVQAESFTQSAPRLTRAELRGKKLFVFGQNFDQGAVIFIDGDRQKTANLDLDSTQVLIAKKAGKSLPRDIIVKLQVLNSSAVLSEEFGFYTGLTITPAADEIRLHVGDRFLLYLPGSDANPTFTWSVAGPDPLIISQVFDLPSVPGGYAFYQIQQRGRTRITAIGSQPCLPPGPIPCPPTAAIRLESVFVVE